MENRELRAGIYRPEEGSRPVSSDPCSRGAWACAGTRGDRALLAAAAARKRRVGEVGLRKPRPRPAMLAIFGPHTVSVSQGNLRGTGF